MADTAEHGIRQMIIENNDTTKTPMNTLAKTSSNPRQATPLLPDTLSQQPAESAVGHASSNRAKREYGLGFGICCAVSLSAAAVSIARQGAPLQGLAWPANILLLSLFGGWLFLLGFRGQKFAPVRFLGGLAFTQCAIVHLFTWVLVAGLLPASDGTSLPQPLRLLGLAQPIKSLPFNAALLLFLSNLGLAISLRMSAAKRGKIPFLLSHGGVWLLCASGLFSHGDLQRWELAVAEGQANALASRNAGTEQRYLPFGVLLRDFSIEFFDPQLTLVDTRESQIIWQKGEPLIDLKTGNSGSIRGWNILVSQFLPSAQPSDQGYVTSPLETSPPAAYVEATRKSDGKSVAGWITCGSSTTATRTLDTETGFRLAMALPRPKRFLSEVTFLRPGKEPYAATIEVNQPISYAGWRINQLSYDESAGKASRWSILEAVRDPWMPIIHLSCALVASGAIFQMMGRLKSQSKGRPS